MLIRLASHLLLALACTTCSARPGTGPSQVQIWRISADSIGALPTSASLAELRRGWPAARDTTYYEHEAIFPALKFSLGDIAALAVQARMDEEAFAPLALDPACPATFWVVVGEAALLPQGVPLSTPWVELEERYGPARASTEVHVVRTSFERLPGWIFDLEADEDELAAVRNHGVAAIRDSARIWRVLLPQLHVPAGCVRD